MMNFHLCKIVVLRSDPIWKITTQITIKNSFIMLGNDPFHLCDQSFETYCDTILFPIVVMSPEKHILTRSFSIVVMSPGKHIVTRSFSLVVMSPGKHIVTRSFFQVVLSPGKHCETILYPSCDESW